jgi:hypothetical protein
MQQKSLLTYWGESFTKHYADFSGRARRSEYWGTVLFNVIAQVVLSVVLVAVLVIWFSSTEMNADVSVVRLSLIMIKVVRSLYNLIWLLPGLAVAVRRLHDIGKSGLNVLWVFLPIIGWIMLLYWFCQDSELGENKWGANPKFVNPE